MSERGLSAGALPTLGGAALTAIALFLPWAGNGWFETSGDDSTSTLGITTQMLWDTTPATLDGQPLVIPLGILVAATVVGALRTSLRWLSIVGSVGVVLVSLLFVNGLRAIDGDYDLPGSVWSTAGIGTWLALAAGAATCAVAIIRRPESGPHGGPRAPQA